MKPLNKPLADCFLNKVRPLHDTTLAKQERCHAKQEMENNETQ